MKKIKILVCSLFLMCSLVIPTVVSASEVIVDHLLEGGTVDPVNRKQPYDPLNGINYWDNKIALPLESDLQANKTKDLGTNLSDELKINNLVANEKPMNTKNYTTNSTKIYVRLKSTVKNRIWVRLYNSSKVLIGETTIMASTTSQTLTFTNLVSFDYYYVQFENVGQSTINITGKIAAK